MLKNASPPPPTGKEKISADVIWRKKYEKQKRKRKKGKEKEKRGSKLVKCKIGKNKAKRPHRS
jgi:hypothetical protein